MSSTIAHITTTVLGVIDTFGVLLETERSGVDITCAIELDVEAARRIFHLPIVHKSALSTVSQRSGQSAITNGCRHLVNREGRQEKETRQHSAGLRPGHNLDVTVESLP